MTDLACARCAVDLGDDPHWDDPYSDPVCDGCCRSCWDTFSSLGGEDRGSGGRDSAAAAHFVDGALGAGSTAGGADAARTQHARPPSARSVR